MRLGGWVEGGAGCTPGVTLDAIATDCDDDLVRPKGSSARTEEEAPLDDMDGRVSGSLGAIGPVPAAEPGVPSAKAVFDVSDEGCREGNDSSTTLIGVSGFVDLRSFDPFLAELDSDFLGMVVSGAVSV